MLRQIIKIDENKCNGCGLCADACHEGAIAMVDGVAKLIRDDYCDGLGNCLPVCPTGAITFEEREAAAYDEAAVQANMTTKNHGGKSIELENHLPCGCPGSSARTISRPAVKEQQAVSMHHAEPAPIESQLRQWPVQIKLVPVSAPYFQNANLLIAADCAAYAHGDFHNQFIKNRVVMIGCPKLDQGDYAEKLTAILRGNNIKSVTVVRMEVPCCGGLEYAAKEALMNCGKMIPWQVVTISADGTVLDI